MASAAGSCALTSPRSCSRACRVLYLGDFDLSGDLIETNTRRVLEREVGGDLRWERLALTEKQVQNYGLPVITKRDRRYKDGHPHRAVETEAISQRVLIDILRARLDDTPARTAHERS